MEQEPEILTITDLKDAATEDIINELFERFDAFVFVFEEKGKEHLQARNGIRRLGMESACLGLLEYGRRILSKQLDEYIVEQYNNDES